MPYKDKSKARKSSFISTWKGRGLKLREGETYEMIYEKVQNTTHCELCNLSFENNSPEMDHDHETGYFRKVLCRKCNASYKTAHKKMSKNNKMGHMWIFISKNKNKNARYSISFKYERKGFKIKQSQSLTKLIAYSFINLLKEPI